MKFKYYTDMFAKMLDFKGESKLGEYWFCVLYNIIFSTLISLVGLPFVKDWNLFMILCDSLAGIYYVIVFLPMLALTIRRLHDANHSGLAILFILIPIVGLIILLVYLVTPSAQKTNAFNGFKNEVLDIGKENEYPFQDQIDKEDNYAIAKQPEDKPAEDLEKPQEKQPETKDNILPEEPKEEEPKQEEKQDVAEQSKGTKPRQRKSKSSASAKEKPLTRSQKVAELQQKQQNGEITEEEYHKQVMEILKH